MASSKKAARDEPEGLNVQNPHESGTLKASGLRAKPPAADNRVVAASRLMLFATREGALVERFEARMPDDVRVLRLDDVFSLLEMVGSHGDRVDPTLIVDQRDGMFRPETIVALSNALPDGAQVLLWGASTEDLRRTRELAPERRFFEAPASTSVEDVAWMCRPGKRGDPPPAPHEAKRLLLVDDDRTYVRSMARLLRTAGYDVSVAHDGHEGLDLCREDTFAAVLTDLHMPGMNGLSFAAVMRLAMGEDAPPVLMVTASAPGSVDETVIDAILQKPVDAKSLLDTVRGLIPDEDD